MNFGLRWVVAMGVLLPPLAYYNGGVPFLLFMLSSILGAGFLSMVIAFATGGADAPRSYTPPDSSEAS